MALLPSAPEWRTIRRRAFRADVLAALGYTKAVETVVVLLTPGQLSTAAGWFAFAVAFSALHVYDEEIAEAVEEATDGS